MTALWDWRVWSDATRLLSRSCLTSSRDVTSFSSRHTSSSRCCRSDCHYKQTLSLHFVSREKNKKLYNVVRYIIYQFLGVFFQLQQTNKQQTLMQPPQPPSTFTLQVIYLYVASLSCVSLEPVSHLQTKPHLTSSTFILQVIYLDNASLSCVPPADQTHLFFLLCQQGLETVSVSQRPLKVQILVQDGGPHLLQLWHLCLQHPLSCILTERKSDVNKHQWLHTDRVRVSV